LDFWKIIWKFFEKFYSPCEIQIYLSRKNEKRHEILEIEILSDPNKCPEMKNLVFSPLKFLVTFPYPKNVIFQNAKSEN
jgi:hypothetical protein